MAATRQKGALRAPVPETEAERLLRDVAAGISAASGDDFFRSLAQCLAQTLHVQFSFIGELVDDNGTARIQTISVCVGGRVVDNFHYELVGTPCENVIKSGICTYPERVQQLFPGDLQLVDLGIESYSGVPLRSAAGTTLGIMVLMDDKPLETVQLAEGLLQIFSVRAAAELERRQNEAAIREREQLLRAILDALPVGVWVADETGKIRLGNPAGQQIWGGARFVGTEQYGEYKGWWADTGKRIAAEEWAMARALRTGETSINELIDIESFDGKRKTILNSALPIRDAAGRITSAIVVNQDITEHQCAQRALHKSEARLAQAQRVARLGHWDWDIVTNELAWSDEIYRIFGLMPREFGATYEAFLGAVHPDDRQLIQDAVNGAVYEGRPYSIDHRVVLPDGVVRIVHEEAVVTFDADRRPLNMFGTAQDITERKRTEEALRKSEKQYRDLMEQASDGIFIADRDANLIAVNARGCEMLGYEEHELLLMNARDFLPLGDDFIAELRNKGSVLVQVSLLHKDGTPIELEISAKMLDDGRMQGIARDVSVRLAAEAEMRKLSSAVQQTADSVVITDSAGSIEYVNKAFERTTGFTREEVLGRNPRIVKSGVHGGGFYRRLWATIVAGEVFRDVFINRKKSGELYYEEKTVTPIKDDRGAITHFVSTGKDITERMQVQERLRFLAHHDPLTRLPNRILFLDRLDQALARSHWHKRVVAVLFLDLDRFKNINDTLGHNVGDFLLQAMAERLQDCVREGDTVARLGGDEFAVLLEEVAQPDDVSAVANKILNAFSFPFSVDRRELFVSTSIGISLHPRDGLDSLTLLKNADAAMYRAKDLGRNNYQYYSDDLGAMALERLTIETGLRRALARHEFVLHYQPLIDARTGRITGIEALLRWRHPDLGLLSPAQFLPVAEDTGLVSPIDEWVAATACRQARAWQLAGLGPLRIAINLSGRRFNDPTFIDFVRRLLDETQLDPALLELEIPEGVIMKNAQFTIDRLREIHVMGVHFAIDDFGTGYSSLSYLRRFPINALKIDKSFIHYVPANEDDAEIVKTIIGMAHSLKLRVVAEGVETGDQVAFLREHGCDLLQGYFFSRPLPAEQLLPILRASAGPSGTDAG